LADQSQPENTATVRFILDGERYELANPDPTRTVLQFLREDLRRKGSKEGCAEGDCGACTVVVAELTEDGDDIDLKAINSCIQFLATLDGKELITVESLQDGPLHPVQQAMVDHHGSQCGFCTPGFVMSLFVLYKTNPQPTRRQIDDALAGNLCRCTGYRPIVDAARAMSSRATDKAWLRHPGPSNAPPERINALRAIQRETSLASACEGRSFFAPHGAAELAELMRKHPEATLLAGGTDVGLWVTKQHRKLQTIIYTARVAELQQLTHSDTHLEIGAAVNLEDAAAAIVEHYPGLDELFLRFASPPIRNAGTLGGNIANGSPIGDSMPALVALNSSLVLRGAAGQREVALEDFYLDYMKNDLRPGEFVETVRVPKSDGQTDVRSYKISKRFDQDISAVCAAFAVRRDGDQVRSARIVFGGMAAIVKRATRCEKILVQQAWSEAGVRAAAEALGEDFAPISDMRASADYRERVAANCLQRFYLDVNGELAETVYGYGRES
jgi:xanthine dehydrogenase small subunit